MQKWFMLYMTYIIYSYRWKWAPKKLNGSICVIITISQTSSFIKPHKKGPQYKQGLEFFYLDLTFRTTGVVQNFGLTRKINSHTLHTRRISMAAKNAVCLELMLIYIIRMRNVKMISIFPCLKFLHLGTQELIIKNSCQKKITCGQSKKNTYCQFYYIWYSCFVNFLRNDER